MAELTPSQTIGPFFHFGLTFPGCSTMTPANGRVITVEGTVADGHGQLVSDALVEIWQANDQGVYRHPADTRYVPGGAFTGFGRVPTDSSGHFAFTTSVPGRVPGPAGVLQAPHLLVSVMARGLLARLLTRMYFENEAANAEDPVLGLVPTARRNTLIAKATEPTRYRFDIVLQGEHETVFFDV